MCMLLPGAPLLPAVLPAELIGGPVVTPLAVHPINPPELDTYIKWRYLRRSSYMTIPPDVATFSECFRPSIGIRT
jgi:hypothetical protein